MDHPGSSEGCPLPPRDQWIAAAPLALALTAAGLALFPGRWAAWAAGGPALLAICFFLAGTKPRDRRPSHLLLAIAGLAAVLLQLGRPVPSPPELLTRGATQVEANWKALLAGMEDVVQEPPPPGTDFSWMAPRVEPLGLRAGLILLSSDASKPLAWTGRTTPLSSAEQTLLLSRLGHGPAVLILRRGLGMRLVYARQTPAPERFILAAERALRSEPQPGRLATGLDPGTDAFVRWQATGEGLRAEVDTEEGIGDRAPLWSMIPLMVPQNGVAGWVNLGVSRRAVSERLHESDRRAVAALTLALFLAGLALGRPGWRVLFLLPARAVLVAAAPWTARWPQVFSPEAPIFKGLPAPLDLLVRNPFEAFLTGITLIILVARLPVPAHRRPRLSLAVLGLGLAAAGAGLVFQQTRDGFLLPAEVLIPSAAGFQEALALLAWSAVPTAGLVLLLRFAGPAPPKGFLLGACLLAGLMIGAVQGMAIRPAVEELAEKRWLPELQGRRYVWTQALRQTLKLTRPPEDPEKLVPERDAIDLWAHSPLGQLGLAAGIWKFGPGGLIEDSFLSGIPPVQPIPRLSGGSGRAVIPESFGPVPETLRFLGGPTHLLLAEEARPGGGSWVVAVLDSPSNLPNRGDELEAQPTGGTRQTLLATGSPYLEAQLSWYDSAGRPLGSELDAGPAPPLTTPKGIRWRQQAVPPALILDVADGEGIVSLAFQRPGPLFRAALIVDRTALLLLLGLFLASVILLVCDRRRIQKRVVLTFKTNVGRFRQQATLFLLLAGLLPLAAVGIAGRAVAIRQAGLQIQAEAARATHSARRLVEDYLELTASGPPLIDDAVSAWLARSVGDDLYFWRNGQLTASSRPDLVRAGIWPERMDGADWKAMTEARQPLLVKRAGMTLSSLAEAVPAAHAQYRGIKGDTGVLTVTLRRASRRIEAGLHDVDRGLLVSAGLLVTLAWALASIATRRLVQPLSELEGATARIAAGDYDRPVPQTGFEETRALARAFGSMASALAVQRRSLEERQAAIETLIAQMPVAVLTVDLQGFVHRLNPNAERLIGAQAGQPLPLGDDPLIAAILRLAAASGEVVETIERPSTNRPTFFRAEGIDIPGLVDGGPVRLIVVEDLTDAVRSERLIAWAEMARRIAHEIKNPLTPISLMVEHVRQLIAENHPDLPRVLDRALATVSDQVRVLRETSREFSDYARLLVARTEPLDLPARLKEWLAPYALAPPPGIRVTLDGPPTLPPLNADPRLLRRAVVNLVDNALAAVQDGGEVVVRWSAVGPPAAAIRIEVADNGPGIEPERIARLFETGETTRETGSGLGLPIAQEAILAHGGRIEVDTAPGAGARFTIILPVAAAAVPAP